MTEAAQRRPIGLGNAVLSRPKGTMSGQSPLDMMHADRMRTPRRAARSTPRQRLGSIVASVVLIVVLAAGWCGLWYYAAAVADRSLAGWVEREAAAGRIYSCGSERISGFPFRIEVTCAEAAADLNSNQPPFAVAAKAITFTAQVYHPTLLVGEIASPLTVAVPGEPPSFTATWSLAQLSVSGLPPSPESFSVILDQPRLDRVDSGNSANAATLFVADHAEMRGRVVGGSANDHPVIDAFVQFASARAPTLHPLVAEPLRGNLDVVLRGFRDLSPKPWPDRFREMQAAGGSIELKSLRIERADATVVGNGTLTLNEHGRLNGVIQVAVVGVEHIVPLLGIDQVIGQGIDRLGGSSGQPAQGLSALDRIVPGLSGVVRQGANASVIDAIKKMGQPTEIDKKPAILLPLRFVDGSVYLGMIRIGEVPPLF
jgi:hypothetical protein